MSVIWHGGNIWIEQPQPRRKPGLFYVVKLADSGTHGQVVGTCCNNADPATALYWAYREAWRRITT